MSVTSACRQVTSHQRFLSYNDRDVFLYTRPRRFGKTTNLTMLYAEVDDAIGQIHRRRYYLGMPERVVLVGMAFFVKVPRVCMELMENGPDGV